MWEYLSVLWEKMVEQFLAFQEEFLGVPEFSSASFMSLNVGNSIGTLLEIIRLRVS